MILVDDTYAIAEQEDFDRLLAYNTSLPTGTFAGKRWKRLMPDGSWYMGEYGEPEGDLVPIRWRRLEVYQ